MEYPKLPLPQERLLRKLREYPEAVPMREVPHHHKVLQALEARGLVVVNKGRTLIRASAMGRRIQLS